MRRYPKSVPDTFFNALPRADEDALRIERGNGAEPLVFDLPQMQ